jgi:hypothetical protein
MIGQQRQILTSLGVDLWIPRNVACQNLRPNSIWRDESSEQILPLAEVVTTPKMQRTVQPIISEPVPVVAKIVAEAINIVSAQPEQRKEPVTATEPQNFELQLLNLAHCVVVVDSTALSDAAKQLWGNISHAIQAEYQQLNWPFPLLDWQDGHGAQSYVQGFLDAHSVDKQLMSLGDLPYSHSKLLKLASLDEMLAEPILKKRLWQFLQNNKQG